jgi:hypothetical protein
MSNEQPSEVRFEIAHVLFIDTVGYRDGTLQSLPAPVVLKNWCLNLGLSAASCLTVTNSVPSVFSESVDYLNYSIRGRDELGGERPECGLNALNCRYAFAHDSCCISNRLTGLQLPHNISVLAQELRSIERCSFVAP